MKIGFLSRNQFGQCHVAAVLKLLTNHVDIVAQRMRPP
jgi:hypothetical protein